MKHLIVSVIEKYRNNKSVTSEEIAEQIMLHNTFTPLDTTLIFKISLFKRFLKKI